MSDTPVEPRIAGRASRLGAPDHHDHHDHHGGCSCGGVRYAVSGPLRDVINCHCTRCRRITGHHMAASAAHPDDIVLSASATLTWYDPVPTVHYGFCNVCGSTLFWKADAEPDKLSIAAGTLDQPTGLRTTKALWVSEAGDYHERQPGIEELALED
ncbi:MAG: GFA family protein [Ilumatobacteraceae bacterium]